MARTFLKTPIDTSDLVTRIKKNTRTDWIKNQSAGWNNQKTVKFSQTLSKYGSCFSFNIQKFSDIYRVHEISSDFYYNETTTLTSSFDTHGERDTLTYNTAQPVEKNSFAVTRCTTTGGATIIHNARSPPRVNFDYQKNANYYKDRTFYDYIITPKIVTTDESLRSLSPQKRECLFDDEIYLRFYQKYSMRECLEECQSNFSLKLCNCVKLGLARGDEARVCGVADGFCYVEVDFLLSNRESEESRRLIDECGCLSDCNSIEYEQDIIVTMIKEGEEKSENTTIPIEFGSLRFHFGSDEYTALKRYASYGVVNFLSNCGGLLGLFLGVTALSVVEVFYFFIFRLTTDLVRNFKRNRKTARVDVTNELFVDDL